MNPTELINHLLESADNLEKAAQLLEYLLSDDCRLNSDGTITLFGQRKLVDRVRGLSVTVRPNEHPPPHFHVIGNGLDASFSIVDCTHIAGKISSNEKCIILYWYEKKRPLLIAIWNSTRPTNCPVGPISETHA
ncbi:MAG: DUF4160 domain-containing protein [Merismopediaceae bacterium]|nr:DUF4160 domain-containing protein [Merismopediaceae bacterium]